ncbi:MAG: YkgJ family cysteine cluster protein [Dehalococcoidales bacterium]|nr:YkgJ family cysteine cluster protein [Dehalococcoidales bacterium]
MSGYLHTADGKEYPVGQRQNPIECFRCGLCCMRHQPPVPPDEVGKIAAGLGMTPDDFLAKYGQLTYVGYLLRQSQGSCVFLDWEKDGMKSSCRIHPFRPEACRNWQASLSRRECRDGLARLKA